jgi:putative ABC transport system substrate-binding protein
MPSRLSTAVIAIVLLSSVVVAEAQQAPKPVTIGVLSALSPEWSRASLEAFRRGLNELGWEEGRNLSIDERFAEGDAARLPGLADELVRRKVDVILASTSASTRAAKKATKTIPIVMVDVGDPVTTKLVTNLARPGGNVTGIANMALGLTQKRLAILKEALPAASRIAILSNPDNLIGPQQWRADEPRARRQSEDREGTRRDDPAGRAAASKRGHRVMEPGGGGLP